MMDIKEFLEKSMNFGLGLAAWSREKIEDIVEDLVRKGEVAQKDARQFAADLVKKGDEQRVEVKKLIDDEIVRVLDKMDLVKKSDVEAKIKEALEKAGITGAPDAPAGDAGASGAQPGQDSVSQDQTE